MTRAPELSLGLFSRPTEAEARQQSKPAKRRLIAFICATRTPSPSVTDASMSLPPNWKTDRTTLPKEGETERPGHQEQGGTICIHSLVVAKEFQKMGLGSILLKSYIQRIKDSKIADRLALLSHDPLVRLYTSHGFENMGPSSATFGGGGWNNLVRCLSCMLSTSSNGIQILEFTGEDED